MIYALEFRKKVLWSTRKLDVIYLHQKFTRKSPVRFRELTEKTFNSINKKKVRI